MLILRAYVNEHKVEEIWVENTGQQKDPDTDIYDYRIVYPIGYEDIAIYHSRKRGWKTLAVYVLEVLEDG